MGSALSCKEYSPVVVTKSGPMRGKIYTFDGRKYYGFLGIPYAEPPVDALRFKKPKKALPWSEVRDCFKFGPRCPQENLQFQWDFNKLPKNEADCLTLNVFCPGDTCHRPTCGYPVMVFIHGGGFSTQSSSIYGDSTIVRNLCSKGVIFVSINYRLGVFGFFTTGDEECPGNMGLWDQTLALQWVNENISQFGGNPDNITLMGHNAGAHSADLLSVSPHSRDLFHRVIAMSGGALCPGAVFTKNGTTMLSRKFARELGWIGLDNDTQGLMAFMSNQPSEKLINKLKPLTSENIWNSPCVPNNDGDFFSKDFLTLRAESPKKDYLMGTTACEGLMLNTVVKTPFTTEGLRSRLRMLYKGIHMAAELEDAIVNFYTEGVYLGDEKAMALRHAQLTGDIVVNNKVLLNAIDLALLGHNVFFYNFEYCNPTDFGIYDFILPLHAATHSFEIRYFLGKGVITKFIPNDEDLKVLEQMTTRLTNFAKCGDPNEANKPIWEKYLAANPYRYFNINYPSSNMADNYQNQRLGLWVEIQKKMDPVIAEFRANLKQELQGEGGNSPPRGDVIDLRTPARDNTAADLETFDLALLVF